jgi:hypothetical protein
VPDVSVDEETEAFYDQIAAALRTAQAGAYSLQQSAPVEVSSRYTLGPADFPSPVWARFFDDQAALVHEAADRLHAAAALAPDPELFAALVDPWEEQAAGSFEALATAAGLSDDGEQYTELVGGRSLPVTATTVLPNWDSLRQYLIALPGYRGPVVVLLWPDTGE